MNKEERTFCTTECWDCLDTKCDSFITQVKKDREEIQKYRKDLVFRDITFLNCPKCNEKIQVNFSRGMHELQQENKQLKEKYLNAVSDYENEKSKNQKAIEYICNNSTRRKIFADIFDEYKNSEPKFYGNIRDIIEILKGE